MLTFVSAGIPSAILLGMLGVFLPRFFTHFHMQLFAIGGTLALVRTIDTLAVDLPIGWAMDKFRHAAWPLSGLVRRRRTLIVMLGTYMLLNPPPHMTHGLPGRLVPARCGSASR